jgi:hypothetical protein
MQGIKLQLQFKIMHVIIISMQFFISQSLFNFIKIRCFQVMNLIFLKAKTF